MVMLSKGINGITGSSETFIFLSIASSFGIPLRKLPLSDSFVSNTHKHNQRSHVDQGIYEHHIYELLRQTVLRLHFQILSPFFWSLLF